VLAGGGLLFDDISNDYELFSPEVGICILGAKT
jgi:hypothetical protein